MKKYDLLQSGDSIIRVLVVQGDRVLVIDCTKRTMPVWVELDTLESYSECTSGDLSETTGVVLVGVDNLGADQRKIMHERYTMIAPILSFVADDKMRTRLICSVAEEHKVSKQTVRSYLCLYLTYMDVAYPAPAQFRLLLQVKWRQCCSGRTSAKQEEFCMYPCLQSSIQFQGSSLESRDGLGKLL